MDSRQLDGIVDQLAAAFRSDYSFNDHADAVLPDRESVSKITHLLLQTMFPGFFASGRVDQCDLERFLRHSLVELEDLCRVQMLRARQFEVRCRDGAMPSNIATIVDEKLAAFMARFMDVRAILETDVAAAFSNDPAAQSHEEVVVAYPCIEAIAVQRLAHELYKLDVPYLPRMMTEVAHSRTGIDIHPGAAIGEHFFIDHGTGVVIGETTTIGKHVTLYHGVTLGAFNPLVKNAADELTRGDKNKRHPDLEDHITVYPGATILGGQTRIGHHSVIGGNAWITESVAPYSRVTMADPQLLIRQKGGSASYDI